jgi:hypothetical protein
MGNLPLSKTLDPADLEALAAELQIVDRAFAHERPQHPLRRWEYALALRAQSTWEDRQLPGARPQGPVVDVGGAGSPFWRMISPDRCRVIDPDGGQDLATHLREGAALASEVYCLSVLEHVGDLDQFLYHLGCLVAPGGLLMLTMDYCADLGDSWPTDRYHFHWMRERIFNERTLRSVAEGFLDRDFHLLGRYDYSHPTAQVYDYTFASLALEKRA